MNGSKRVPYNMTSIRLSQLSRMAQGQLQGVDAVCSGVSIDSRTLKVGNLFIAIRGDRFDGHEFAESARTAGACGVMVERRLDINLPQIIVADTRLALGKLGAAWRQAHQAKVVGVTGSNGKTTAKEMIASILGVNAPVLKTRGNLNNDLGVPLTLLELTQEHRYAVIEMGANHAGEIAYVAGLARPEVGLITNAGAAHLEGFGSLEGVAYAKGELIGALGDDGIAILNADDAFVGLWRNIAGSRAMLTFGFSEHAGVRGLAESLRISHGVSGFETRFDYLHQDIRYELRLRLAGRHNVANALAAAAACLALGIGFEQIRVGLASVVPVSGRMQPVFMANGTLLINDTYNANPSSFEAALNVLLELPGEPWVALGAFGELGEESAELHAALGREARHRGVSRLFATGPHAERSVEAFGAGGIYCPEQAELISKLQEQLREDVVLLVKGSRAQRMERVIEALVTSREPRCC